MFCNILHRLRYKNNTTRENVDYELDSGDLVFIPDSVNQTHKHSLIKRSRHIEPRISVLVFLK